MNKYSVLGILLFFGLNSCTKNELQKGLGSDGFKSVKFNEQKIELNPELSKRLGYDKLTIAEGDYEVDYSSQDYGTVVFNIQDVLKSKSLLKSGEQPDGFGIRVRIATRSSGCSQGIGFRCGFVKVDSQEVIDPERDKLADVTVDESAQILQVNFLEPVDWEELAND